MSSHVLQMREALRRDLAARTPENPAVEGWRSYAQCDEDGIVRACLSKIADRTALSGTFVEIGCGDGRENNTAQLLIDGYRGVWCDGDPDLIEGILEGLGNTAFGRLMVKQARISLTSAASIARNARMFLGVDTVDFFSLDLDGNDFHVCPPFLEELNPKLVCVEYNAVFRPPTRVVMAYEEAHVWQGDDHFSASLASWNDLLTSRGYTLICCNLSGANAFFVRSDLADPFPAYDIAELHMPPRYDLVGAYGGHAPSMKWLAQGLKNSTARPDPAFNTPYLLPVEKETQVSFTDYGPMYVYTADQVIGASLIGAGAFQESKIGVVTDFLRAAYGFSPKTFFDIGANIGTHTCYALLRASYERGFCFEPEQKNYVLLNRNVAVNDLSDRVEIFRSAVSDFQGSIEMELSDVNYGDHRIRATNTSVSFGEESERSYESVPCTTLGLFLRQRDINTSETLFWIDTQGHEGKIFKGLEDFLSNRTSPVYVLAEFWPYGIERSGGKDEYFEMLATCTQIFDTNQDGWTSGQIVSIDELLETYKVFLDRTEKEDHPHSDLLLIFG